MDKKKIHVDMENLAVPEVSFDDEETVKVKHENEVSGYKTEIDYSGAIPVTRIVKVIKKNVLILNGSPRVNGNTDLLCKEIKKGVIDAGNNAEVISVNDYNIKPCVGCESCKDTKKCVLNDDMKKIYEKMNSADVLVIASPVYFFGLSSQLKTIVDRFHNPLRNTFNIEGFALVLVGGSKNPNVFEGLKKSFENAVKYFDVKNMGELFISDTRGKGDIATKKHELQKAYNLGKKL